MKNEISKKLEELKKERGRIAEFSMFGDPTLSIEDGDDPESIPMLKNQRQRLSVLFFDIIEQYFPRLYMIIETIINFDRIPQENPIFLNKEVRGTSTSQEL